MSYAQINQLFHFLFVFHWKDGKKEKIAALAKGRLASKYSDVV